jgi:cystathionine beta-lyase family protein involved in aluminum resistance
MMLPESSLFPIFYGIDTQVKKNLARVLEAFRQHRVGSHHFSSVTGYGHDDLGRATLDQVFATIVQAEAAIVRPQFVSGTHAIACALYGVLRPGDEVLAVAGHPYDTLEEVIGLSGQGSGILSRIWDYLSRVTVDRCRHRSTGAVWHTAVQAQAPDWC